MKTVILTAPPGWGKTRTASRLRTTLGCTVVVDDWRPSQSLTPGALHLTNVPPEQLSHTLRKQASVVSHGWAC